MTVPRHSGGLSEDGNHALVAILERINTVQAQLVAIRGWAEELIHRHNQEGDDAPV